MTKSSLKREKRVAELCTKLVDARDDEIESILLQCDWQDLLLYAINKIPDQLSERILRRLPLSSTSVCGALGCTSYDLNRWDQQGLLPHDFKRFMSTTTSTKERRFWRADTIANADVKKLREKSPGCFDKLKSARTTFDAHEVIAIANALRVERDWLSQNETTTKTKTIERYDNGVVKCVRWLVGNGILKPVARFRNIVSWECDEVRFFSNLEADVPRVGRIADLGFEFGPSSDLHARGHFGFVSDLPFVQLPTTFLSWREKQIKAIEERTPLHHKSRSKHEEVHSLLSQIFPRSIDVGDIEETIIAQIFGECAFFDETWLHDNGTWAFLQGRLYVKTKEMLALGMLAA